MIDLKRLSRYCKDDFCLIENYENAINDKEVTWHCHHRLETDANMTQKELKEKNLYFHRPASELIFLTPTEHLHLHNIGERNSIYGMKGADSPCYGRTITEEENSKRSKSLKKYYEDPINRKKCGDTRRNAVLTNEHKQLLSDINKGARHMSNGIERHFVLKDQIPYYISKGYHFGTK